MSYGPFNPCRDHVTRAAPGTSHELLERTNGSGTKEPGPPRGNLGGRVLRIPRVWEIPPTMAGVRTTLDTMRAMAREDARSTLVQNTAANVEEYAARSALPFAPYLRGWFGRLWVQEDDPTELELLRMPSYQLQRLAATGHLVGDCDDASVLAGSLALAAGRPARLVAVSTTVSKVPNHVWTQIFSRRVGQWYDVDVLRPPGGGLPAVTSSVVVNL